MIETIFVLLATFQLKHFLADYPLQNTYMLGKFKDGWDFLLPLLAHVGVHAIFTLCIAYAFTRSVGFAFGVALLDLCVHFAMDRTKAGKKYLGRFKSLSGKEFSSATPVEKRGNKFFWWALGFDQSVHHLTHYVIIYLIVTHV